MGEKMKKTDRSKTEIKKIASTIPVEGCTDVPAFLKLLYNALKEHFKPYSYYYFSEDLGLGYCPTSRLIINGSRKVTEKSVRKICEHLGIVKEKRDYLIKLARVASKKGDETAVDSLIESKKSIISEESAEQLEFFRNWYTAALFEFLRFYEGS